MWKWFLPVSLTKNCCNSTADAQRIPGSLSIPQCFDTEVVVSMLPCHRYPSLAPLVPPKAIEAPILSRTVAQFHPAAIHFVCTQTQLPDSCDQAASLSEEMEVLNEVAFLCMEPMYVCVCIFECVWYENGRTYSTGIFTERFELF